MPVIYQQTPYGTLYFRISTTELEQKLQEDYWVVAGIVIGLLLISYLIALWLQQRLVFPITQLATTVDQIAQQHDFDKRLDYDHANEIGTLYRSFDELLYQIQRSQQALAKSNFEWNHAMDYFEDAIFLISLDGTISCDNLDDTAKNYLQRTHAASRHMARLIDDMLALYRINLSQFEREPLNLSCLARECIHKYTQTHPNRKVEVIIPSSIHAEGDRYLLTIAIDNLLANAWKFTRDIEHPRIEFGAKTAKGETIFFVKDNGIGFNVQYADKLFGIFQRLHSDKFEGTGIGLATVQRIIQRHGGKIWAEGSVNKGACFFFTLENISSP